MITISGKTLGQKKPLFADWSIALPPEWSSGDGHQPTLRELLSRIVRVEVDAFQNRQKDQQMIRALTSKQISEGAARGKVDMGGREYTPQNVDVETAIATAIEAFEDGLYLVVIDEEEKRELDSFLALTPDSRVTFIRLTLLAGG